MNSLDEVKGLCRIEPADRGTPHWIWCGAITNKAARIWAPDYTAVQKAQASGAPAAPLMRSQPGRRAAWHLSTGQALPVGWRVFATCQEDACVAHFGAGTGERAGRQISLLGKHKHSIRHQLASRATGRARSKLTPDLIREIQQSSETGRSLAQRFGIGETLVSKVRIHGSLSHQPLGGLFSGLTRRTA